MGTGTDVAMKSAGVTLVAETCAASSRARVPKPPDNGEHQTEPFLHFIYNSLGVPSQPEFSIRSLGFAEPDDCSRRDELQLSFCDRQCFAWRAQLLRPELE